MRAKSWMVLTVLFLLLTSCNLPVSNASPTAGSLQETPVVDAVGTSVELTTVVRLTELAGSATVVIPGSAASTPIQPPAIAASEAPSLTPCFPLLTAKTTANIRSGPDTAYTVIGSMPLGSTARIAGRNDANTWWYIEFLGGSGGYAWVAGIVSTASCLPPVVEVVAAPPLPTAAPTAIIPTPAATDISQPPAAGAPDLVAAGMQYWPNPAKNNQPISIQVKVTNSGSAAAGQFNVVWLSNQDKPGCDWTVSGLDAGASKNLECTFTYNGSATATYWVTLIADSGNQITESNEGNNSRDAQLKVQP